MMKRPNDWENVREMTDRKRLPLGAYVCRVKQAAVQNTDYGEQLCLVFDIIEGEYSGYYAEEFRANTREDKKWKGVLRYWLPSEDGSERDGWTKSALKGMVTAFESSNPGFSFNWDEKTLAGKIIGILYRNEEWEYQGKTGWSPRPFRAMSVDKVRSGDFTFPKDKPLKNKPAPSYVGYGESYDNGMSSFAGSYETMDGEDSKLPF